MKIVPLIASLLVGLSAVGADIRVLYQTGWEATPAVPAWVPGNVIPQNLWLEDGDNLSPARNRVVANGTADANPFGTPVVARTGNQFHRFTASSSTATTEGEYIWTDLLDAFDTRPDDYNIVSASIDMYVPSGDSADGSYYGLFGYDYHASSDAFLFDYGFFIVPNARAIVLVLNGTVVTSATGMFSYNSWFNLDIQADYISGAVKIFTNGVAVPQLARTNLFIVGSSLSDVDLFSQNSKTTPNPRVVFTDNYRIVAIRPTPPAPILSIEPGAIGEWHISWNAAFSDWILEWTQDLGAMAWMEDGSTPTITGTVASVDLTEQPPHTFYRLRKP
jgi:hypothetical protein